MPHPFREINGRAIRTFTAQLLAAAGWSLSWAGLDRDRNRAAARAAYEGDQAPLRALLDERLRPGRLAARGPGRSGFIGP